MSPTAKERKAVIMVFEAIAKQGIHGDTGDIMSLAACMLTYVLGRDITPIQTADWTLEIIHPPELDDIDPPADIHRR